MRLLIDANILLDVLQKREPYFHDSSLIWKLCETNSAEGYVSSLTFANLIYVMRKELTPEKIEELQSVSTQTASSQEMSEISDKAGLLLLPRQNIWQEFNDKD